MRRTTEPNLYLSFTETSCVAAWVPYVQYQYPNYSANYISWGKGSVRLQLINQRSDFAFALFTGGLDNVRDSIGPLSLLYVSKLLRTSLADDHTRVLILILILTIVLNSDAIAAEERQC
jgi:hypothetical protein